MAAASSDGAPLTRDACRAHLEQSTFRYRASDYAQRYPKWPGSVGLEIEMLPAVPGASRAPDQPPGSFKLQGPGETSAAVLKAFAEAKGHRTALTEDDHGQPLLLNIFMEQEDNISFEPGGQVEFSSKPYPCLSEAVRRMRDVQGQLAEVFRPHGVELVQVGINPWYTVPEIGLQMAKGRYRAMDRHFAAIGEYGQRMMRQTCTVQVNVDFGSDAATLAKRYLASQLLSPIAAATFAYSPVVDRKQQGIPGFRTRVWRHADPSRTGVPGLDKLSAQLSRPTRDLCIDTYLEFVLDASVVFVTGLDYKTPEKRITFGEWLTTPIDGVRPTLDDLKTHLSLMFPEVRPRGFLELRSIDCQPRAWQVVPAAYVTGLLYDPQALDQLIELVLPRRAEVPDLLVRAERGLADPVLAQLAQEAMAIAAEGFSRLPPCFKEAGSERELAVFREHFTARARTPGDDLIERLQREGRVFPAFATLQSLEDYWAGLAT